MPVPSVLVQEHLNINDLHFSDDGIISISEELIKPVIVKQKVSVLNNVQ